MMAMVVCVSDFWVSTKMGDQTLNRDLLDYFDGEIVYCEETGDDSLNQQLSEICRSFEDEVSGSQKTDKSALNQLQLNRIQSLEDEGLVDSFFRMVYLLKEEQGPSFFLDLVLNFSRDARIVMGDMAKALFSESSVVDFDVLNQHCIKLKGSSACIGARKVSNVCDVFIQAVGKKSKDECLEALRNIEREYHDLQSKTESIMQLEKEIVSAESPQS
ncbi:hypothetical protein HAX54_020242 [Datura stramonium]|uniref:Histidine-containing phosphotransfer protein n=1 Tax=Datura stramonium TaxID=4076 RepID=A0ABS8UQV5_DATST|nr:hypothetical protein [Datura stramonium]